MAIQSFNDQTSSGRDGVSVTAATAGYNRSRGVYIGASGNYDFTWDGSTWVLFNGCIAGTVLPIQVIGARHNAGSTAPDAGDVVFLY